MPITDRTVRVPISSIIVERDERQRREISTVDLESSISRIGLISPVIVTSDLRLKAGERRLTACRNLGHVDILCRFAEDLSPIEEQIIELEENIKRLDLPWPDLVAAVRRVHSLHLAVDSDWTQSQTGEVLSLTQGIISMYLKVGEELSDERVAEAKTVREAHNVLLRREQRAAGDALQELLDTPDSLPSSPAVIGLANIGTEMGVSPAARLLSPIYQPAAAPPESILQESFLEWAPKYTGPKFSLIHCDFPYGIEFASGPQGLGSETAVYADTRDIYRELLECLCSNLDRLMSVSGHLMFWYSQKHHNLTMETFWRLAPSLSFTTFPLIWLKSDNAGIASDPRHGPRHIYETCLFASRGNRQIIRVVGDAYAAPTDKRLHPSCKPEPMLRHFMQMTTDEHTSMLDPTCGSGSSLRAAESLGANRVLGLEISPDSCHLARQALLMARRARRAAEVVPA